MNGGVFFGMNEIKQMQLLFVNRIFFAVHEKSLMQAAIQK